MHTTQKYRAVGCSYEGRQDQNYQGDHYPQNWGAEDASYKNTQKDQHYQKEAKCSKVSDRKDDQGKSAATGEVVLLMTKWFVRGANEEGAERPTSRRRRTFTHQNFLHLRNKNPGLLLDRFSIQKSFQNP